MQRFFANIPEKIGCGNPMIHSDKLSLSSYLTVGQKKAGFLQLSEKPARM